MCIIAVRLPPVAVYSSLTPAVFGLDPGGSGPFSWCRKVPVVYRHRLGGPRPGSRSSCWPARLSIAACQAGLQRRPHRRQSWPSEKSTLQNGLQAVFLPSQGPRPTQEAEIASWAAYRGGKALLDHSVHRPGFALPSSRQVFRPWRVTSGCAAARTRARLSGGHGVDVASVIYPGLSARRVARLRARSGWTLAAVLSRLDGCCYGGCAPPPGAAGLVIALAPQARTIAG